MENNQSGTFNSHFGHEEENDDWISLGSVGDDAHSTSSNRDNNTSHSHNEQEHNTNSRSHDTIFVSPNEDFNAGRNSSSHFVGSSSSNNNNNNDTASSQKRSNNGDGANNDARMRSIRGRHERNINLKQNFVEKPLTMFPKILFFHLMREIWYSDHAIRFGIIFILTGMCFQLLSFVILFSFSLYKLPQMIISTIITGFFSYFILFHLDNPISDFMKALSSSNELNQTQQTGNTDHFFMEVFFTCLEYINGIILRRICICVFFILPIVMEMKALMILSSLATEGIAENKSISCFLGWGICWAFVIVQLIIFVPMHFQIRKSSPISTPTNSNGASIRRKWENGIYQFGPITLVKKASTTLFDIRIHSWMYLYVLALFTATFMMQTNQIHKPIILAAPFLLATGSFLILSCHGKQEMDGEEGGDLFLNILRRALRYSLCDILELVGDDIAEDDLLRLNMLQWMLDYWATSGNSNGNGNEGSASSTSASSRRNNREGLNTSGTSGSTTTTRNNESPASTANDATPPRDLGQDTSTRNDIGGNNRYTSTHNQTNTNPGNKDSQPMPSPARPTSGMKLPSFINIDERARPAVLSYKQAVSEFPPSRNTCIILAVAKRCPAIILVLCLHLSGSLNANYVTIILLPMIILEIMRISEWMNACHRSLTIERMRRTHNNNDRDEETSSNNNFNIESLLPGDMEPMEILLSSDSYSSFNRGSSLQVWMNIKSSVSALESSLTAVKCVNTANIATDVAFDVLSLAKLGLEVKDKGLPHGMSVLAKEFLNFNLEKTMNQSSDRSSRMHNEQQNQEQQDSYAKTAINLMNNGKILTKNVSDLLEDGKNENNILHPVVCFASTVFGKGWLWDREKDNSSQSTKQNEDNNHTDNNTMGQGVNNEEQESTQTKTEQENVAKPNDQDGKEDKNNEDKVQTDFVDMSYDIDSNMSQSEEVESESIKSRENHTIVSVEQQSEEREAHFQPTPIETQPASIRVGREDRQGNTPTSLKVDEFTLELQSKEGNQDSPLILRESNEKESIEESQIASMNNREENNNGLNLLGAGLAVIAGAVVGGIALATKNGERDDITDDTRRNRSTLTIERLDDDEE